MPDSSSSAAAAPVPGRLANCALFCPDSSRRSRTSSQTAAAADGSPLAALLLEAAVVKQVPERKTLLGAQPHNAVFPAVFRRMVKKPPEGWNILGGQRKQQGGARKIEELFQAFISQLPDKSLREADNFKIGVQLELNLPVCNGMFFSFFSQHEPVPLSADRSVAVRSPIHANRWYIRAIGTTVLIVLL